MHVGQAAVIARGRGERQLAGFEPTHCVERAEADPSAVEGLGHAVDRVRDVPGTERTHRLERIGGLRVLHRGGATVTDLHLVPARQHLEHRLRAEHGPAAERGAVLDALEEEARRGTVVGCHQAPVREHRRELVAHQAAREKMHAHGARHGRKAIGGRAARLQRTSTAFPQEAPGAPSRDRRRGGARSRRRWRWHPPRPAAPAASARRTGA